MSRVNRTRGKDNRGSRRRVVAVERAVEPAVPASRPAPCDRPQERLYQVVGRDAGGNEFVIAWCSGLIEAHVQANYANERAHRTGVVALIRDLPIDMVPRLAGMSDEERRKLDLRWLRRLVS